MGDLRIYMAIGLPTLTIVIALVANLVRSPASGPSSARFALT
jgi:hypothetical protein